MGNRWTSEQAKVVGKVGGLKGAEARRRRAAEDALGPLNDLLRQALLDVRPDLTFTDVRPLSALLGRAYRAGYKRGYGSGWRMRKQERKQAA